MIVDTREVRAWAQEQGREVSAKGRVSRQVVAEYLRAHPRLARQLAAEAGIEVPARGPVALATCMTIATT